MPTTVHIPKPLLDAVDRRARKLRLSRNRLIIRALEKEIESHAAWSPDFFEQLRRTAPDDVQAVDEMLDAIRSRRRSKEPPRL